jgi:hypothetical protein
VIYGLEFVTRVCSTFVVYLATKGPKECTVAMNT